jgi:hypothetical protein
MKISDAIKALETIAAKHGDVQVYGDCAYCGRSTAVGLVAVKPETARLRAREASEPAEGGQP